MDQNLRNNLLYSGQWQPPFELAHETPIEGGSRNFGPTRLLDEQLFVSKGGYLACYDPVSREKIWEIEPGQPGLISTLAHSGALFANIAFAASRLDMKTGELLWQGDEKETIHAMSSSSFFTAVRADQHHEVRCRTIESHDIGWTAEYRRGSVSQIIPSDPYLIVGGGSGFDVLDLATGKLLWQLDCLSWGENNYPEKADVWKKEFAEAVNTSPHLSLGPALDGVLFLSIDFGMVLALDLESGATRWMSEMAGPLDVAHTIILRQGSLYCNRYQRLGTTSYLSCVNAADGSIVFSQDDDYTPGGCTNPVMLDHLYLGGGAEHLAAFDVEAGEFVWRYSYPGKGRVFGSRPCPVPGGFVFTSGELGKLLWFGSDN